RAMSGAVKIPVTVKMRAGWNESEVNAPTLARMAEDAGARAVTVHGRTAAQSYSGFSDWELIDRVADALSIPVYGSGDCVEAEQMVERLRTTRVAGVMVGRGALRNPWIFEQARAIIDGREPREITMAERGRFLLEYIDLLLAERVDEDEGFRHSAPGHTAATPVDTTARGRRKWVINKLRALNAWYTKGIEGGSQLRVAINSAESIDQLREIIIGFFGVEAGAETAGPAR